MKKFKKMLALGLACVVFAGCGSCMADNSDITVLVNGTAVEFDSKPTIKDERTLVPLRAIFEALGAEVDWNESTQTVTSKRDETTVTLTIGENKISVNGITYELDVPAQIIDDRTYVPVRAISESFDCGVGWNNDTRTVIINEDGTVDNGSGSAAELNHTYTTQYGKVNAVSVPQFAFDYSDNWKITTEDVAKSSRDSLLENVVLENGRGVKINYINFGNLGGYGKNITRYEVSKVADSQFTAGYKEREDGSVADLAAEWGNFIVGEIKAVGDYDMKTGELVPFDGGTTYAVVPSSYVGTHEATGLTGFYEEFSTDYGRYLLYAEAPDGVFTEQEKQEVIQILSSFKRISEFL